MPQTQLVPGNLLIRAACGCYRFGIQDIDATRITGCREHPSGTRKLHAEPVICLEDISRAIEEFKVALDDNGCRTYACIYANDDGDGYDGYCNTCAEPKSSYPRDAPF